MEMEKCKGMRQEVALEQLTLAASTHTNLLMCFAVTVSEKIKHGARSHVTAVAPVISSVVVFEGVGGRS